MIPHPTNLVFAAGAFHFSPQTGIVFDESLRNVALNLQALLTKSTGFPLFIQPIDEFDHSDSFIRLQISPDKSLPPEGYSLEVNPNQVVISGGSPAGVFYGIQSLRQLLPPVTENADSVPNLDLFVPEVRIEDQPRYPWRGLHLDVSRHIYPVAFLKKFIDVMALYKLNTFHLHLTDDQGWRIEIKKYPLLTEVGAFRESTPLPHDRGKSDQTPYGGFYTQEDMRELVAYAEERYITIVPEIEMPGHALAALAAYPAMGCKGAGYKVGQVWGMQDEAFCPGNDDLYPFLEDILTEVIAIFPSDYIHIGGDECKKIQWESCPKCQARIKREGLKDENQLQSYFLERIGSFLEEKQRKMLGWDEILEGGLPSNAAVMSWRGAEGGIEAATKGHDVIMSPNTHCYFDYFQSKNTSDEPPAIGGFLPLVKVYEFNPLEGVPAESRKYVLGGQGNIWTEYLPTSSLVEYMAFPRALALAEVLWRGKGDDFGDFGDRVKEQLERLDMLGVTYRPFD
jgi:hexosaminidase